MKTYIVHGAPLSGKTAYVQNHKGKNDLIYDFDIIMSALSGLSTHKHNDNLLSYVIDVRGLIISKLKSEKNIDNAWIITTRVSEDLKKSLVGLNAEYIEIKADIKTVKERLRNNPDGRDIEVWDEAIDSYFMATKDNSGFYNTKEWKRKRKVILKRDNYKCKECIRFGATTEATTVHHVLPLSTRPDLKLDNRNLISLCEEHHEKMHNRFTNELSKLGEEWKRRIERKYPEMTTLGSFSF